MHSGFDRLGLSPNLFKQRVCLSFDEFTMEIWSNSAALIKELSNYFMPYVTSNAGSISKRVYLYEQAPIGMPLTWVDWPREAGKTGQKEQICEAEDGRWIHKVKTGVIFFQHQTQPTAVGPCLKHSSQIINFVINQYINYLQQCGGLICHAACIEIEQQGVAIAAFSGGGKSTTMLKLMEHNDTKFVSNDRLFLFAHDDGVIAKGVSKQPRVNPGTLLHNETLRHLLSSEQQEALSMLSPTELWSLEQKFDVHIDQHYGDNRSTNSTRLQHVILLNWSQQSRKDTSLTQINLAERRELIEAIAKSPGPFFQQQNGEFLATAAAPADKQYLDCLERLCVWEACGTADFTRLVDLINEKLLCLSR